MSIWTYKPDPAKHLDFGKNTMLEAIGLQILEFTDDDRVIGRLPIDHRTVQPFGILHGGATATLAESLGSIASQFVLPDPQNGRVVGVELNINHLGQAQGDHVIGIASPIKLGRTLHVWQIDIEDAEGRKVSRARLTVMVM